MKHFDDKIGFGPFEEKKNSVSSGYDVVQIKRMFSSMLLANGLLVEQVTQFLFSKET